MFYESVNFITDGDCAQFYQGTYTIVLFSIFKTLHKTALETIESVKTKYPFDFNRNKANYMNGSEKFLAFLDIKQTIKENIFSCVV